MLTKTTGSEFVRDNILEVIGELPVSNTQMYRVLLVEDAKGNKGISAQKWWRPNPESAWQVGKGFKLDSSQSVNMGQLLLHAATKLA